jgi:hypothetical protein
MKWKETLSKKAIGARPRMIELCTDMPVSCRLISADLLPVWWKHSQLMQEGASIMGRMTASRSGGD